MAAGIQPNNEDPVNAQATTAFLSPEVNIASKSCLIFDYNIVSDLNVILYPSNGSSPSTVWSVGAFTGKFCLARDEYHMIKMKQI